MKLRFSDVDLQSVWNGCVPVPTSGFGCLCCQRHSAHRLPNHSIVFGFLGLVVLLNVLLIAFPVIASATGDNWSKSDIGTAWTTATGASWDPTSAVISVSSGGDQTPGTLTTINYLTGEPSPQSGLVWIESRDLAGPSSVDEGISDLGTIIRIHQSSFLVAGLVLGGPGFGGSFVGVRVDTEISMFDSEGMPVAIENSYLVPMMAFPDVVSASAFVDDIESSQGNPNEPPVLACINPEWRGSSGEECCLFAAAYSARISGCKNAFWARQVICFTAALGVSGATLRYCLKFCVVAGPASIACAKACFFISAGTGLGSLIGCLIANEALYRACCFDAQADYWQSLGAHGCAAKAPIASISGGDGQVTEGDPGK